MSQTPYTPTHMTKARTRNDPPESVDVAIIGAGIGGLTAAAFLARAGLKVACFDHHYVAGGCTTQFARGGSKERYNFDVGLHYIGDCGERGMIPAILHALDIEQVFNPLDPDGFDTFVFPDFEFQVPVGIDRYRDRLVGLFPKEKKGIDRYVRLLHEVDNIGAKQDRKQGKLTPSMILNVAFGGRLLAKYQNATIGEFLDSCTSNPQLRGILLGQHGDYGLPPSKVSALLHAGLAVHYFRGAYYPAGGGQILADKVAAQAEAAGGSIHLRRGVSKILVEEGRAVGVLTEPHKGEAEMVRARAVLSNADLKKTLLELVDPEHLPGERVQRVRDYEMASALIITCLGVTADMATKGMRASNYWVFDSYDHEEAYRKLREDAPFTPTGAYITSATFKDPGNPDHAPEGVTSVEVMCLAPGEPAAWGVNEEEAWGKAYRQNDAYEAHKARIEDHLIGRLDTLFPGTRETVVFRETATPMTHIRYTRSSGGTSYGLAATPGQFMKNRPGYRTPVQGLYMCGASTRSGHGIVGAMMSGHRSALRVAADLEKPFPAELPGLNHP